MRSGVIPSDLALYRLVKAGESGLNLKLTDLFDRRIEIPNLFDILKTLVTKEKIPITIKGFSAVLIRRLISVQEYVDREVESKVREAQRRTG